MEIKFEDTFWKAAGRALLLCMVIFVLLPFLMMVLTSFITLPEINVMFYLLLGLLMIPLEMVSIPLYLILAKLNMINTYQGVMLPYFITAFGMFVIHEAIVPIPKDYIEAARIDGAGEFWIFARVIVPMVRVAIITVIIIKFLWTWNEFFWPLLVINTKEVKTVTLGLAKFSTDLFQRYGQLNAAVVLSVIPTILLFTVSRRYIVRGIMMPGVKG